MKFPSKVRVGAHVYSLRFDDELHRHNLTGLCSTEPLWISIAPNTMAPTSEKETVLHELMHAAWNQTSLAKKVSSDDQEEAVWALAPLLLSVLRDNPKLVSYLVEKEVR